MKMEKSGPLLLQPCQKTPLPKVYPIFKEMICGYVETESQSDLKLIPTSKYPEAYPPHFNSLPLIMFHLSYIREDEDGM